MVDLDFPEALFFGGMDYNEQNTRRIDLVETRRRVGRYRSAMKAEVQRLWEDLGRVNAGLHAADRQGNTAPHWDTAVLLTAKLHALVKSLSAEIAKAERRYEQSCEAPPPVPPAAAVPPPAAAGVTLPTSEPVVAVKPATVQLSKPGPATLAALVRRIS